METDSCLLTFVTDLAEFLLSFFHALLPAAATRTCIVICKHCFFLTNRGAPTIFSSGGGGGEFFHV